MNGQQFACAATLGDDRFGKQCDGGGGGGGGGRR